MQTKRQTDEKTETSCQVDKKVAHCIQTDKEEAVQGDGQITGRYEKKQEGLQNIQIVRQLDRFGRQAWRCANMQAMRWADTNKQWAKELQSKRQTHTNKQTGTVKDTQAEEEGWRWEEYSLSVL